MKTILVPLDLSAAAVRVCDAACELAKLTGARPILLHIVQPPPVMMSDVYAFDASQLGMLSAAAEKNAVQKLRALAGAVHAFRTGRAILTDSSAVIVECCLVGRGWPGCGGCGCDRLYGKRMVV